MIAMAESEEGTWFQLKFQGLLKARLDCDFALKINIKAMNKSGGELLQCAVLKRSTDLGRNCRFARGNSVPLCLPIPKF